MARRRGLSRRSSANRPGVSRKSMAAGVVFFGLNFLESQSRRGSGILALPVWPTWILAGSGFAPVSHWKTLLFPEPEKPTRPTFMCGGRGSEDWDQERAD